MEQYFEKKPTVKSDKKSFTWHFNNVEFTFYGDNGVFSKNKVDYGSISLIKSFLSNYKGEKEILDLGCGYGPIGIILAKFLNDANIDMTDINSRAISLAKENIVINNITNAKVFQSDMFENIDKKYESVLLNPPIRAGKSTIYKMYDESIKHLNLYGSFYVVIQKKQGARSTMAKLEQVYGNCECIKKDKGYMILKSIYSMI